MRIEATVTLSAPGEFDMSADEAAEAILKALGGDEGVDTCTCLVHMGVVGLAGVDPNPPPPDPLQAEPA
jgi:hypothetical protein